MSSRLDRREGCGLNANVTAGQKRGLDTLSLVRPGEVVQKRGVHWHSRPKVELRETSAEKRVNSESLGDSANSSSSSSSIATSLLHFESFHLKKTKTHSL